MHSEDPEVSTRGEHDVDREKSAPPDAEKASGCAPPKERLLGDIESQIVGMQYYDAPWKPGESMHLERESDNRFDGNSIRVENSRFRTVGHLTRRDSFWLAPLIDAGRLRLEARIPPSAVNTDNKCPVVLSALLCPKGEPLLEKTNVTNRLEALHEVVRQAYHGARDYTDATLVHQLAEGLQPLMHQDLLPETRLLVALFPAVAQEIRGVTSRRSEGRLQGILENLALGESLHHRNLTVFPLVWPNSRESPYTLLATAIERDQAIVEEVDEHGDVANLRVVNRLERPLLIPQGEILVGAKQNRVVSVTVLVPALSTFTLPVSCVEQGRWRYRGRNFRSGFCAPPTLRRKNLRAVYRSRDARGVPEGNQQQVWDDVDACLARMDVHSETASLAEGFEAAEKRLLEYRRNLPLPSNASGVLVAQNQRILGMDLFDAPETLATLWERLADAYYIETIHDRRRRGRTDRAVAEQFVERLATLARPRVPAIGLGDEFDIHGEDVVGAALVLSGTLCHLSAFRDDG